MGFSDTQVRQLSARLDGKHVRQRWQDGRQLAYLEGWHVIAEANRIFGFAAWDRETVKTTCVWQGYDGPTATCAYSAKVRIRVRSGAEVILREGHGTGTGRGESTGQAHEQALKEAETDATKRALMTFGNAFGLALYDPEQRQVRQPRHRGTGKDKETAALAWPLFASTGRVIASYAEATDFCSAFRQWLEAADGLEELNGFWSRNRVTIDLLRRKRPELTTRAGLHYAELLGRMAERKARSLAAEAAAEKRQNVAEGQAPRDKPADPTPEPASTTAAPPSESSPEAKSPEPASKRPAAPSKSGPSSTTSKPPATASHKTADGGPIDKSRLLLPAPRRLRRPNHLRYVASLACAICGRRPAQAHHLTFAEPRALGRKTGDDWAVPLCAAHHRSLHAAGSEQAWWRTHEIDPIRLAEELWKDRPG